MSGSRRVAASLALLLLLTGCGSSARRSQTADRLPDATLPSLTGGSPVALRTLRGPLVVNLWAQWCGPCRRELPIYEQFARKYAGRVAVLGVDWQDVQADRARAMAKEAGLTYPLVVDSEPVIRSRGLPKLVLVDAQGRITHQENVEIHDLAQLERLVADHLGVRS